MGLLGIVWGTSTGWSQEARWEPLGPEGGNFAGIIVDVSDEQKVTAITSSPASTYRSLDGGASWNQLSDISNSSISDFLAIDSSNFLASSYGTVYRTANAGGRWSQISISYEDGYPLYMAKHPTVSNTVYAVGYGYNYQGGNFSYRMVFFTSTTGGKQWKSTKFLSYDYFYPEDFSIAPSNPKVMYVVAYKEEDGVYGQILLRTTDGGATWKDITSKIQLTENEQITGVKIDPLDENRVYLTGSKLFLSEDGGETWGRLTGEEIYAYSLVFHPTDAQKIFALSYNGYFYSVDRGAHWLAYANSEYPLQGTGYDLGFSPLNPSTMYLATSSSLYKSENGGESWIPSQKNIYNSIISSMAIAPSDPKTLYIEHQNNREMVTHDGGNTWESLAYFQSTGGVNAMWVHPTNPQQLLTMDQYGYPTSKIYQSMDSGTTWNEVATYFDSGYCFGQDNRDPNVVYAGGSWTDETGLKPAIAKSVDGGSTWPTRFVLPIANTENLYSNCINWITLSRENSMVIYAAGVDGDKAAVYRTDNGGGVWKIITNNLLTLHTTYSYYSYANTILCHPENEYTLLVGTVENTFISTNGGNSWKRSRLNHGTNALAFDFITHRIYAATADDGVYYSEDGTIWQSLDTALQGVECLSLCMNPDDGSIYVGTYGRGVWRYSSQVGVNDWSLY